MPARELAQFVPFLFADEASNLFSLRKLSTRPFVLASIERWVATPEQEAALQLLLRSLGAELFVIWSGGAVWLGQAEQPTRLHPVGALPRFAGFEVLIVDAALQTRWAQRDEVFEAAAVDALLEALRGAVATMGLVRPGTPRDALLMTSLISAFALTLLDACASPRAASPAGETSSGAFDLSRLTLPTLARPPSEAK